MAYLFVHFKEKLSPDGEQVYYGISKDGLHWEQVNNGNPILTAELGERGCRDIEIIKLKNNDYIILTTDLSIAYRMDENHQINWKEVNSTGSKCLRMWRTNDLIHFSSETLINFNRQDFGCMWAPEVFYDDCNDEYLIHWGSTVEADHYSHMSIYCCTTKDFATFSKPKLFFTKENEILDTHLRKIDGIYHLFYKNAENPGMNMHATSENLYGPYEHDNAFADFMNTLEKPGSYEAATTMVLPDGRWCLLLDFFGCEKEKMGYVPFVSDKLGDTNFVCAPGLMKFPYGFKHGGIIEINNEEYNRLKSM